MQLSVCVGDPASGSWGPRLNYGNDHCISSQLLNLAFSQVSCAGTFPSHLLFISHPLRISSAILVGNAKGFSATVNSASDSASSSDHIADASGMQAAFLGSASA